MSKSLLFVTFQVEAMSFPATWHELKKRLGASNSSRSTDLYPNWRRIDGSGFTIWLSEPRLADSLASPPIWEIKLESLALLPPEGVNQWDEIYQTLWHFVQSTGLPFSVTSSEELY